MDLRKVTIIMSGVYAICILFLPYEKIKNKYLREAIRIILILIWLATSLKISNFW